MAGTRKLEVIIAGDAKGAVNAFGDVSTAASGAENKLGGLAKTALAGLSTAAIVNFGGEVLNLGAKLDAWRLKTDTVFEAQAASVRQWADANNEAFGVTDDELAGLAASFGDLLKPMGFTSSQAADMSTKVVGLAGALSAWSGGTVGAAEASDILAAAMLGETDGLKQLGISISAADIEARLAAKGQSELEGSARQMAEAVATQELIFEKSTDAQKAFAQGGNEALTAQNKLKAGIGEVKERIATALVPALATLVSGVADKLIPAFEGAVRAGKAVADWAKDNKPVVEAIAGVIGVLLVNAVIRWGVQSTIAAAKAVAGFVASQAASIAATASAVAGFAATIAGWIAAGAAALVSGAQMAAAWLIGLGPIAIVVAAVAGAVALIVVHWDTIKNAAKAVWDWISTNWPLLLAIITGPIGLAVLAVVRNWDTIKQKISEVKQWIGDRIGDIAGFFRDLPGKIGGFFSGLADTIKAPFKAAFDKIKEWWNNTVGGFGFKVPGWVPFAGGKEFRIPKMATGGIVSGPTVALIGEAGPEAVIPLDRMGDFGLDGGGRAIHVHIHAGNVVTGTRDLIGLINEGVRQGVRLQTAP